MKSSGVAEKDITTQYYNIDPRYQTYNCRITPIIYNTPSVGGGSTGSAGSAIAVPTVPLASGELSLVWKASRGKLRGLVGKAKVG